MSGVECYPCSHFGALQMFLTHLNGAVNNHNDVFWGEEPPEEVSEKHLKGAEVTAWIAFNLRHGPHWFQDGRGKTMTVNGERCCEIINKFNTELRQRFTVHRRSRMWFQQDGATPHTAHDSFDLLKELFGSRVISFRTTHEWTSHSPGSSETESSAEYSVQANSLRTSSPVLLVSGITNRKILYTCIIGLYMKFIRTLVEQNV